MRASMWRELRIQCIQGMSNLTGDSCGDNVKLQNVRFGAQAMRVER